MKVHSIKTEKEDTCPSTDKYIMVYGLLLGNEMDKNTDISHRMNHENIMLGKKAYHEKTHIVGFHLYKMSRIGQSIESESRFIVA